MKHFFLFFALLLTLSTCKKDDLDCVPDLPCATQAGANTFGCYINGKPWVSGIAPYVLDPTVHELNVNYDEPNYSYNDFHIFQFTATAVDSFAYEFWALAFGPLLTTGDLSHQQLSTFRAEVYLEYLPDVRRVFQLDTLSPYDITITKLDFDKNIVAGKFAFTGITEDKKDTIIVTNGRFDLIYLPF